MKEGYNFFVKNKRGQIWIETVIYTLIAFVMIGLVLTFARPKIEELKDKSLIDQSIIMLKEIESTILNIGSPGNRRILELGIKKGELAIDGANDTIIFEMESKHTYSEPGKKVNNGNLIISTEKKGNINIVKITRDYNSSYNIQYNGLDELKILTKSSVPYRLFLTNEGKDSNNKIIINVSII